MTTKGRVFSTATQTGPGRLLAVAQPFLPLEYVDSNMVKTVIPEKYLNVHNKALGVLDNPITMGMLEQYLMYHELLAERLPLVERMLKEQYLPIIVPAFTRDAPLRVPYAGGELIRDPVQMPGTSRGEAITSSQSDFGWALLGNHWRMLDKIHKEYHANPAAFPDADLDLRVMYIAMCPILTFNTVQGSPQESTIINVFPDIVENVNEYMLAKEKLPMGDYKLEQGFQDPFLRYMPSFYDVDAAMVQVRSREGELQHEKRSRLLSDVGYNKWLTAQMYGNIFSRIPREELYYFGTSTLFWHEIAQKAASNAGKTVRKVTIMRNVDYPLMGAGEQSALNILGGFIAYEMLGRRRVMSDRL